MTESKTVKKAAAPKAAATKKAAAPKSTAKKVVLDINAETVGFKAGDVYQALATAEKPLSVAEIAKAAKITTEEALLGMGWLFKEGKIKDAEGKITLA
ncbi:MAG: winged helix-turn-helix domain-containing protein [Prevotellaceae bacterium]|nr:winged helix-turn-helix domain-containing protein [Prevotellaceae bacterium]